MSVPSAHATPPLSDPVADHASAPVSKAQRQLRLRLRPAGPDTGYVDGAWWPRSRDLAAELPALATVLAVRLGPVYRVVYALNAWGTAPRRIHFDEHQVRLEGFHSQDENVISVVSSDRRRVRLLVVPPEVNETAGHDALMAAAGRDNSGTPAEILAAAGIQPGVRMPEPRESDRSPHHQETGEKTPLDPGEAR